MVERGVIANRDRKLQVADMSGLRFGKITPTDLDAFIDFGDKLFVFIEGKFSGAPVLYGQMLAIERLCDACDMPPRRYAFAIIVDHYAPSHQDVDFANTIVRTYRMGREWKHPLKRGTTLIEAINRLRAYVDNKTRLRVIGGDR